MKTRTLGRTGLNISEIGLGCGGKFGFTDTPEKTAEQILNHAIDNGVNFFDTGSNYGQGLSEVRLGRYLKENRKRIILATKCGSRLFGEAGKETYVKRDFTYDGLIKSAEESLIRLKADYVDLMQLHTAPANAIQPESEAVTALKEMQKRGMTRFIGASCDLNRAIDIMQIGIFDTIQISFNICMQEAIERVLPLAKEKNTGVIIKEPLANCFFLGKPKPGEDDSWQIPTWERAQNFLFMRKLTNPLPVQAALRFVLDHESVTTAIAATVNIEHLSQNILASEMPNLSSELFLEIRNQRIKNL